MKKYLIILFTLIACNLMSDDVRIVWYANPESDNVTHYRVYKAESGDSANLVLVLIDSIAHPVGVDTFYVTSFDSNYIRAGIQPINANGACPTVSESRVFSQQELALPSPALFAGPAIRRN